jgi:hypothetical protein
VGAHVWDLDCGWNSGECNLIKGFFECFFALKNYLILGLEVFIEQCSRPIINFLVLEISAIQEKGRIF